MCAQLRDEERARRLYALLAPYDDRFIAVAHGAACDGAVSHALGLLAWTLGDADVAQERFEDALSLHRRAGARLFIARTQCELAAVLWKVGNPVDRERARRLRSDAVGTYRQLGLEHRARTESERDPS